MMKKRRRLRKLRLRPRARLLWPLAPSRRTKRPSWWSTVSPLPSNAVPGRAAERLKIAFSNECRGSYQVQQFLLMPDILYAKFRFVNPRFTFFFWRSRIKRQALFIITHDLWAGWDWISAWCLLERVVSLKNDLLFSCD